MNVAFTKTTAISTPAKFAELMMNAGSLFRKVAEYLSMRSDVLAIEYCYALLAVPDQRAPEAWGTIDARLTEIYSSGPATIFSTVETTPISSKFIVQVHAARLIDGRAVLIKLKQPGLDEQTTQYRQEITAVVQALLTNKLLRNTTVDRFSEDVMNWLLAQMNFSQQIAALLQLQQLAKDNAVIIPDVHMGLSNPQVMVVDQPESAPVTELLHDTGLVHNVLTFCLDLVTKYRIVSTGLHINNIVFLRENAFAITATGELVTFDKMIAVDMRRLLICLYETKHEEMADIIGNYTSGEPTDLAGFKNALQSQFPPAPDAQTKPAPFESNAFQPHISISAELREFPVIQLAEHVYPLADKFKVTVHPAVVNVLNMLFMAEMVALRFQHTAAPMRRIAQEYFFYQSIRDWANQVTGSGKLGLTELINLMPLKINEAFSSMIDGGERWLNHFNRLDTRQEIREKHQRLLILAVLSVSLALLLMLPAVQQPVALPLRIMLGTCLSGIYLYIFLKLIK